MPLINQIDTLPDDLPVPIDDGACAHLPGMVLPSLALAATDGTSVDLSALRGRSVVFAYPRTGRPGQPSLADDWNSIPGARGCTPQTCGYRDLAGEFDRLGYRIFGLSTQDSSYQREMATRLKLPFPVLSDARLELAAALALPIMTVAGHRLIKRLALAIEDGRIVHVWYPVFPPDANAATVLAWARS
jgi:peroxiredoxin (alkyl hydroperoxide reductase subunit C)